MRNPGILGLAVVAALVSGCAFEAQETAPPPDPEPTQKAEYAFDPSLFKFGVWVNDDGQGEAGGWQRASTVLTFKDLRTSWISPDTWQCRITVQVPIRARYYGIISPEVAAKWSADTAIVASDQVMKTRPKWIAALFCPQFASKMMKLFKDAARADIGARVTSP